MTIIKKNNFMLGLRPTFSDFFDADDFGFDRLLIRDWVPAVNIAEEDLKYEIEIAAPGMQKNDFKLHIENGILTISAKHKFEKEEKKKNYTRQEFRFQSFKRVFNLPENAREEGMKAHYENGILKLEVFKKAAMNSKSKEIAVA